MSDSGDAIDSQVDSLKSTARLVAREMMRRGIEIRVISGKHSLFEYKHQGEWHFMRSVQGDSESAVAASITRDKVLTGVVCESIGVGHPEIWDKVEPLAVFLDRVKEVVVKPVSGSHGQGVVVGLNSVEDVSQAIDHALRYGASDYLVQRQVSGFDYRVVCIAGRYAAALKRMPAAVIGDGVSSLRELIDRENQNPERGEPRRADFIKIDLLAARQYLGDRYASEIPADGLLVEVVGVPNIGLGGSGEDVTDDLPHFIVEAAEKIAAKLRLGVVGVDFIWDEVSSSADVIEINAVPGLDIHESARFGKPRNVIGSLVDHILQTER